MNKARKYSSSRIKRIQKRISDVDKLKSFNQMNLALNLAEYMKVKGFNNTTFAEATKKNISEITRWLSGTHNFTIDTLTEICHAFDVSMEKLFRFEKLSTTQIKTATITIRTPVIHDEKNKQVPDLSFGGIRNFKKTDSLYFKSLSGKN